MKSTREFILPTNCPYPLCRLEKIQGAQKLKKKKKSRIDVLLIPLVNRSNIVMYEKRPGFHVTQIDRRIERMGVHGG